VNGSTTTQDSLLNGRITLAQPRQGYRVAVDPVLLAASIATDGAQRILDAGCGVGAAALCLAARAPYCTVVGVERQPAITELARANVAANGFGGRITIEEASFPDYVALNRDGFDQVMMNPPFYEDGKYTPSPNPNKAASHGEDAISLEDWIVGACTVLRAEGTLTLIHRADRMGEILASLDRRFGAVLVFPFWPRAGAEAKRVLVSAIKGRKTLPRLLPGLALHNPDGGFTEAAEAILRDGRGLDLTASCA
jgi:tRNA1(Val) A37 N6-methylase TrmN6